MRIFVMAIGLLIAAGIPTQDRTVNATVVDRTVMVKWGAPRERPGGEWIGLYRPGAPVEPFPPATLWRFVPEGESGEMALDLPDSGEWEVRYLSAANVQLASTRIVVTDSAPVRSRLRKLTYYENGIRLWETETMDDTEAARHLTNVSLSDRKGIEARIEVRYAAVTYPADADEIGTWRK